MGYKIIIKTLAEQDIKQAAEWYNKNAPHVLVGFLTELKNSFPYYNRTLSIFKRGIMKSGLSSLESFHSVFTIL